MSNQLSLPTRHSHLPAVQSATCKAIRESCLVGKFKPDQLGLYVIEVNRLRFETEIVEKATN